MVGVNYPKDWTICNLGLNCNQEILGDCLLRDRNKNQLRFRRNKYSQTTKAIHRTTNIGRVIQAVGGVPGINLACGVKLGVTVCVRVGDGVIDGVWLGYWIVISGNGNRVVVGV